MDKIETTNQPTMGTWDKLSTTEVERKPKVEFEINKPVEVTFIEDEPREYQGENGAYYCFDVSQLQEEKVIMTSAWSLLRTLKTRTPLKGKTVVITKKMEKGKQFFQVDDKQSQAPKVVQSRKF